MADRRAQIEARLAAAEADAERHRRLAEQWKEVADAADDVIRAVLAALYRGPDTDAVIRAKKVMAERDALAQRLARVEALHRPVEVEPSDTICGECSVRLPSGRFMPVVEWPCPTMAALGGEDR